jgi:hypothetical protein
MRPLTLCLLCALALPAAAQIYKYTDANGNTVFTNQPPEGTKSEAVQLHPTNTVAPPPPPANAPTDSSSKPPAASQIYEVLELTGLPDNEALRANNGTFQVGVHLQPSLRPGHNLLLLLDGKPHGQPSNVPLLQVDTADRGEHSLAVQVISGASVVQQSPTVTFTVQRVNTQSPALRAPPTPPKPTPRPAS